MRTPWHHLISYQSLVFGMYRHACRSYPLLGTTSAAIKAWFRACIANACSSYALLGTTSVAISSSPIVAVRIALKRSFSDLSLLNEFQFARTSRPADIGPNIGPQKKISDIGPM
jgi:hypothetical protein